MYLSDLRQPSNQKNPGLVAIMSARAREETLSSMIKHVRAQENVMNRIHWEERTERTGHARQAGVPGTRSTPSVKDSLTECEESIETRFLRCTLSEVVNEIKSEDKHKQQLMDTRREGARARQREAEERARMAQLEATKNRQQRALHGYAVKSMDNLGGCSVPAQPRRQPTCGGEVKNTPQQTNAEHFVSRALSMQSK